VAATIIGNWKLFFLFSHDKFEQCFVKSFGWYDNHDSIYITMEYLPNGDLQNHLGSPLPESEARTIVTQVLEGLQFMHQNGFTHRDLKPANILVVFKHPEWWVKIADFGISKRVTGDLTAMRTPICTRDFAAPEVLGFGESGSYTNAVDIWSLGVIAFLILTGKSLFKDPNRLNQYVIGVFAFPCDVLLANQVSKEGCEFIKHSIAPAAKDRPGAEESGRSPWLACSAEPAVLETQRRADGSKTQETEIFSSNLEDTAIWSTQEESLDIEASASWSTQHQSSAVSSPPKSVTTEYVAQPPSPHSASKPKSAPSPGFPGTTSPKPRSHPSVYIKTSSKAVSAEMADLKPSASFNTQDESLLPQPHSRESELLPKTSILESISQASDPIYWKKLRKLKGDSKHVSGVAFPPNSRLVASPEGNNTVRLRDAITKRTCMSLSGHSSWFKAAAFSPDGKLIVSGGSDNTVRLWNTATGMACATLMGHSKAVQAVAFSSDSNLVASGGNDNTVKLWNPTTGGNCATLVGHTKTIQAVAFSPDGKLMASGGIDAKIIIWELATKAAYMTLKTSHWVSTLAFSLNGKLIASGDAKGKITFWTSATEMEPIDVSDYLKM